MLNGQSIFITGGTGTLGKAFIKRVLKDYPKVKEVVIYSRDEMKQYDLKQTYPAQQYPQLRWIIGDVRDLEHLTNKMKGADVVIHTAAMKHITICEENPEECLKTNVGGSKNIIQAALANGVEKSILCSTDKAVEPISIYGNSKQASEKLFLNAGDEKSKFSIVRLGNIWGSRGSVVPLFKRLSKTGEIPITHVDMTRFFCTAEQSAQYLLYTIQSMVGGDIIIPKMSNRRIVDIANELAPKCKHKIIGLRGYEKLQERLIADIEKNSLIENEHYWVIPPMNMDKHQAEMYYGSGIIKYADTTQETKCLLTGHHLN